jgi:hypothetical protein
LSTPQFHLDVTTDQDDGVVRLNLRDDAGRHLDGHAVRLGDHPPALWEGLFDTRAHVSRYAGSTRFTGKPATADDLMTRLGVFLGREVLGKDVTARLHEGIRRRDLVIHLPPTEDDPLAAAFARVPWEIARPDEDAPPLMGRNLAVRTVLAEASDVLPEPPAADEPIRVLLVFAEDPGARPLAMRLLSSWAGPWCRLWTSLSRPIWRSSSGRLAWTCSRRTRRRSGRWGKASTSGPEPASTSTDRC